MHARWIAGVRELSTTERLRRMLDLTQCGLDMSRRAIARAHPDWDRQQMGIEFVRIHYGKDLAGGLRAYLEGAST